MSADSRIEAITKRIVERSKPTREVYLDRTRRAISKGVHRSTLSCGNLAHGFAVCSPRDKEALAGDVVPNLGIITAYNDMLSAHQPFEHYPTLIRDHARSIGATAAIDMIDRHSPGSTRRLTVGADKGFDTADFVAEMRRACVTPHVAQ